MMTWIKRLSLIVGTLMLMWVVIALTPPTVATLFMGGIGACYFISIPMSEKI
ncbi:MAG: hypothetical protein FWG67_08185 [Defluviitaleaceae bacterium]|nr:hypothetical protein [Defluviitaleaceae bacterium]